MSTATCLSSTLSATCSQRPMKNCRKVSVTMIVKRYPINVVVLNLCGQLTTKFSLAVWPSMGVHTLALEFFFTIIACWVTVCE